MVCSSRLASPCRRPRPSAAPQHRVRDGPVVRRGLPPGRRAAQMHGPQPACRIRCRAEHRSLGSRYPRRGAPHVDPIRTRIPQASEAKRLRLRGQRTPFIHATHPRLATPARPFRARRPAAPRWPAGTAPRRAAAVLPGRVRLAHPGRQDAAGGSVPRGVMRRRQPRSCRACPRSLEPRSGGFPCASQPRLPPGIVLSSVASRRSRMLGSR